MVFANMRAVLLVLACLAYDAPARIVHAKSEHENDSRAIATLLLASPSLARGVRRTTRPVSQAEEASKFDIKELAGVTEPLGFFDPVGFSEGKTEGKLRFYREVEIKHGRLGMLAALGFLVGENFHPLFGGDIDVAGIYAFQQTPLETFWGIVVAAIASLELFSIFAFENPAGGEPWAIRSDHTPGDLGFDPLSLKPTDPEELKTMQTKELNNGRLAMIAAAGMIAQELATGQKLFA
jgi:hypothetical protein